MRAQYQDDPLLAFQSFGGTLLLGDVEASPLHEPTK